MQKVQISRAILPQNVLDAFNSREHLADRSETGKLNRDMHIDKRMRSMQAGLHRRNPIICPNGAIFLDQSLAVCSWLLHAFSSGASH